MLEFSDIKARLGLTRGQANHYVVAGLITVADANVGTGRARRFTLINLLEFAVAKKLVEHGFKVHEIQEIMVHLRQAYPPLRTERAWHDPPRGSALAVVNRRHAQVLPLDKVDLRRLLRQNSPRPRRFESIVLVNLDEELRALMKEEA